MFTLLRNTEVCLLALALAAACNEPRGSDDRNAATARGDAARDAATDARVDAGRLPVDCSQNASACDAGALSSQIDAARPLATDGAVRSEDAGPFKSPVEAGGGVTRDAGPSTRDGAVRDADTGKGCGAGGRKCNRANGAYGICTPSGTCGGCEQTSDCVEVYGDGFQCDTMNNVCFPRI